MNTQPTHALLNAIRARAIDQADGSMTPWDIDCKNDYDIEDLEGISLARVSLRVAGTSHTHGNGRLDPPTTELHICYNAEVDVFLTDDSDAPEAHYDISDNVSITL